MAGLERFVELGLVAQLPRDLEVFGVLDGGEDRASDIARFLQQHRGRQIARRGVDRVAEQCELQQRYRNHRRERDAVAPQLQQFLAQHRADAAQEAAGSDDSERAHWKLSLARAMRSMNTSSSDGDARCQTRPGRSR